MEWVVLAVALAALALFLLSGRAKRARERAELAEQAERVRLTAGEDVTRLGEDLQILGSETAGRELDTATSQDYRRALDAYDAAKTAVEQVRRPEDVRAVTESLEDGRYAVACVRARLAGEPVPVRRPPCFFNPQHGPSTTDVPWAPPGGVPRPVPACAADAERVQLGAEPDSRKVLVGAGGRRPYWEAGPGYAPYAGGYFAPYAMSGLLPGVLMGAVLGGAFGGWGNDGYGGDGGDSVGYDGGGYDGGGGDFGGGDFGGGGDF